MRRWTGHPITWILDIGDSIFGDRVLMFPTISNGVAHMQSDCDDVNGSRSLVTGLAFIPRYIEGGPGFRRSPGVPVESILSESLSQNPAA